MLSAPASAGASSLNVLRFAPDPLRAGGRPCDCCAAEKLHSPTKLPLGARDRAAFARIELDRRAHRSGKALIDAFANVVVVSAVKQLDMQRQASGLCNGVEPVFNQLGIPFAQLLLRETSFPHEIRPPGDVQSHARQRLIHRRICGAITADPGLVAERIDQRLPQSQRRVLGRVVLINMQIAIDLHRHVDQRVFRKLLDHMVKEADPRCNVVSPRSVKVYFNLDRGFCGFALNPANSHNRGAINALVSRASEDRISRAYPGKRTDKRLTRARAIST